MLSLLIGWRGTGSCGKRAAVALLDVHDDTEQDREQVELVADEENGVAPREDDIGRSQVIDPAWNEAHAAKLEGRLEQVEHPDEEGELDEQAGSIQKGD